MTTAPLYARIQEDMKNAMRSQKKQQLAAIRLIIAAIKQYEIDTRASATDEIVTEILGKQLKQRRDSINQYQAAERHDLVAQEQFEADIIQTYLPTPLTATEIEALVATAISTTSATSMRDMGKVMSLLKPELQGQADMASVSQLIKSKLNS